MYPYQTAVVAVDDAIEALLNTYGDDYEYNAEAFAQQMGVDRPTASSMLQAHRQAQPFTRYAMVCRGFGRAARWFPVHGKASRDFIAGDFTHVAHEGANRIMDDWRHELRATFQHDPRAKRALQQHYVPLRAVLAEVVAVMGRIGQQISKNPDLTLVAELQELIPVIAKVGSNGAKAKSTP